MNWPDVLDLVFTEQQMVSTATASEFDMEAFQSFMRARTT